MVPLAVVLLVALNIRDTDFTEAAQTATAGLITLIPEGLVLLMSVTLAVAAMRLARQRTLIQQMAATEGLAAVDTICVDKTGTLTDGSLRLVAVEAAGGDAKGDAERALARFAASAGERNRTLQTIAERYPAQPERVGAEVPFSSSWKWSGVTLNGQQLRARRPRRARGHRGADAAAGAAACALRAHRRGQARGRLRAKPPPRFPAIPASQPPPPLEPRALVVLEETLREDAAETVQFMREQEVDLKLISGDARETVTAVAQAVGVPEDAGVIEGPQLPDERGAIAEAADAELDLLPDHARSRRKRSFPRSATAAATRR